uniref:MORN repeat-containing protein 5 n=1 Tax=Anopheles funestus TaxID=62324 RepID=A0A182R6T9_ANOFN
MSTSQQDCGIFEGPDETRVGLQDGVEKPLSLEANDEYINSGQEMKDVVCEIKLKRYEGTRNKKNEPSGNGVAKYTNGDYYEGFFKKGVFSGEGVLRQRSGHRYEGAFRKGFREGRGTQIYPDCSTYNGDWLRGVRHGYGVYSYSNKDTYEGNWCMDKKHGIGVYSFAQNGLRMRGSWTEGHLAGPVEILFGSVRYHGTWDGKVLSNADESVFNIASKYLLRGSIKCGSFDEYVWTPSEIGRYNFARLPLEPLPVPIPMMDCQDSDSSEESVDS